MNDDRPGCLSASGAVARPSRHTRSADGSGHDRRQTRAPSRASATITHTPETMQMSTRTDTPMIDERIALDAWWRFVWRGHRLMDVYANGILVDAAEVSPFEWERGISLAGPGDFIAAVDEYLSNGTAHDVLGSLA